MYRYICTLVTNRYEIRLSFNVHYEWSHLNTYERFDSNIEWKWKKLSLLWAFSVYFPPVAADERQALQVCCITLPLLKKDIPVLSFCFCLVGAAAWRMGWKQEKFAWVQQNKQSRRLKMSPTHLLSSPALMVLKCQTRKIRPLVSRAQHFRQSACVHPWWAT